jgi:hypothetical protein
MGNVIFCKINEEIGINNSNINNISNNNNDFNKSNEILSINKNIIEKDDNNDNNTKEIILKINHPNKNSTILNNEKEKEKEEKNRNEKNNKIISNGAEIQSTDNYSINNFQGGICQKNKCYSEIRKLLENQSENICCISLYDDILNFSIGDYRLIHCEKISLHSGKELSSSYNYRDYFIYVSEKIHSENCELCTCMMSRNNFLIIYSSYCDFNWPLRFDHIKYDNLDLNTYYTFTGFLEMSSYNVPFDFDGDKILYIDYMDNSVRSINIVKTLNKKRFLVF